MRMKALVLSMALGGLLLPGCGVGSSPRSEQGGHGSASEEDAKVQQGLARLSPEDRNLAEQQKYCAVDTENRLGSMGKPAKVMVKDQPVFLCCSGCKKAVDRDPEKYLEIAQNLRSQSAGKNKGKENKTSSN